MDWREQVDGLLPLAPFSKEPRQVARGAQLPEAGPLAPCRCERPPERSFRGGAVIRPQPPHDGALAALKFGEAIEGPAALSQRQGLRDRLECLDVAGRGLRLGQHRSHDA